MPAEPRPEGRLATIRGEWTVEEFVAWAHLRGSQGYDLRIESCTIRDVGNFFAPYFEDEDETNAESNGTYNAR